MHRRNGHLGVRTSAIVAYLLLSTSSGDAVVAQSAAELGLIDGEYELVDSVQVCSAMELEAAKGYDLTASTNGSRLWFNTALTLVSWARERVGGEGPPLFIPQEDYFRAYLCVTRLPEEEAPEFIRIAREYQQHTLVEYRRSEVLDTAATVDHPREALAVKTWWPDGDAARKQYTLIDTLSDPHLQVVNKREVRYRILDYEDFMLIDDVSGIRGRPTSGVLGLMFKILGTARVQWSRMAISERNEQMVRANGKKIFAKTNVVMVEPSGLGRKVPDDRLDLRELRDILERPIEVSYRPWPF